MKKQLLLLLLGALVSVNALFAQDINTYENKGLFPHHKTYQEKPSFKSPLEFMQTHFKANTTFGVKIIHHETDQLGITHYRLQQTINGIPIEKSMYMVHVKDGHVISSNGEWYKNVPALQNRGGIKEKEALETALKDVDAKEYIWQTETAKSLAAKGQFKDGDLDYSKPKGELVYVSVKNELNASSLRLAYKFDVFATQPMSKSNIFVDASNGSILFKESHIHEANTNGTAATGNYGNKPITVDQVGGTYYARQNGARSIELYNMNGNYLPQNGSTPNGTTVSSSSSTFSGSGNAAYYIDAYWGAEVTLDLYQEKFNRNSYNGSGGKVNIFVNGSGQGSSNNAFWFGSFAYFGNGYSGNPFTPLDVVSHEITHGLTQNTANLTYQGESGALNEAFSDVLGAYADHYAGVGQKWIMGEYISLKRSMSNPNQHNQPDTYQGSYWVNTNSSQDYGGVHTNSGVFNHWFYLVSEGGSGSNDNGNSYSVSAIGIDKAAQIAYRALTYYLTASSGYSAARNAVINSARDLYGNGSCEEAAVTDAMHAVGVGSQYSGNCGGSNTCDTLTGLSVSGVSTSSATVSWNAVSGVSNYSVEYKKSTDASYTSTSASSNSKTLSGLSDNTTYNVRVRYTCSNGTTADYATTSFTTSNNTGSCNTITGLTYSSVTSSAATVSWNAVSGVTSYNLEYKKSTDASYTSSSVSGSSASLSGLSANTTYNIRVNYTCSNGQTASYTNTSFTTEDNNTGGCGVADYVPGQYYNAGDQVVYNGIIYQAIYNGTYWSPAYGYWAYVGPCTSSGNGCGVSDYVQGQTYNAGDQVVYQGYIYQAIYNGTYWSPAYGYWSYVGVCSNGYGFAASPISNTEEKLSVYPNPANDVATIEFSVAPLKTNELLVMDMMGKVVFRKTIDINNNIQSIQLRVDNLKAGIYLVKVGSMVRRLSVR